MRDVRFLPSADDGLLVTFGSIGFDDLHGLAAETRAVDGIEAAIVGQSSLLVVARDTELHRIRAAIDGILRRGVAPPAEREVTRHVIDVDFSEAHAPELGLLLDRTMLSKEELIARIAELELRARYLGFLPGFAYLEGWPEPWSLPRRAIARERVPGGSFAIAGATAGIYPAESPGGWNILGRTGTALWNPHGLRPNRIAAGDFVTIRSGPFVAESASGPGPGVLDAEPLAELLAAGVATIVTGAPRMDRYRFGLAPGGAFDTPSMRLANRLVGNGDDAMLLECAVLGPRLRFFRDSAIAITGATVDATLDGVRIPMRARVAVAKGSTFDVGAIRGGLRVVVAIRGGLTDTAPRWNAQPPRLTRGGLVWCAEAGERRMPLVPPPPGNRLEIAVVAGPHDVEPPLIEHLLEREWTVTPTLDRIGVRLTSGAAPTELPASLPSCGMRFGTVQWHPGGELVVMGPDHPITGGYLQPLTVPGGELWKVAQLTPGERVRFVRSGR